jgi:hypothetical protein
MTAATMTALAKPPPPNNRTFLAILALLGVGAALGVAVGVWNVLRGPVVETLRAAQLAPLPRSASEVTADSVAAGHGYQVKVRFHAPPADVDRWVQTSPSLRKLQPERPSAETRRYVLPESPAARTVQVTVDDAQGQVQIELVRG